MVKLMELTFLEKQVVEQIEENCRFWGSNMCKTKTVLKYCQEERGIFDPDAIVADLIMRGVLCSPKPGYISIRREGELQTCIKTKLERLALMLEPCLACDEICPLYAVLSVAPKGLTDSYVPCPHGTWTLWCPHVGADECKECPVLKRRGEKK